MIFHSVGNFRTSQLTIRPLFFRPQPQTIIKTQKKKRLGHQSHPSMVGEIIYGQPPD
jgi:hypothetical protein